MDFLLDGVLILSLFGPLRFSNATMVPISTSRRSMRCWPVTGLSH